MTRVSGCRDRVSAREFIFVVLVFTSIALYALGANPFKGEGNAPMWLLSGYAGWSSHGFSEVVGHPERSDILDAFIPRWMDLKEQIRSGGGLWSAIVSNGSPGFLDLSNGALNPSFLMFLAIDEPWLGFYLGLLVKLVTASLGAFYLARLFVGSSAAVFCGLVYAYCGFNSAWFYWPQVSASSIAPWFLWSIFAWTISRDIKYYLAVFLSSILLIVSGFPAVSAYFFYVFAFLVVFLIISGRLEVGGAAILVLIVVSTFLVCALPIISLAATLSHADLSYRSGGTPYVFPGDVAYLWDPYLRGGVRVEKTLFMGWIALVLSFFGFVICFIAKTMRRLAWVSVFLLMILIISFFIIYGIAPASMVSALPGIGNSLWSRMAVVMALALSVLSAIGVEGLLITFKKKRNFHYFAIVVVFIVCAYQISVQIRLFRDFNAPSLAADFFPKTKSIRYVSENSGVTHSVLADDSFMISGTLGAYGIAEWFAHGLKSADEKAALERLVSKPFVTPTAARFSYDAISKDADYAARLGVKFIISQSLKGSQVLGVDLHDNYPHPLLSKSRLIQRFSLDNGIRLQSLGVVFGTYNKKISTGRVVVVLNNGSEMVASSEVAADTIKDNALTIFRFDDVPLSPGSYSFELFQHDFSAGETVAAWISAGAVEGAGHLYIDGKKTNDAIAYKVFQSSGACCMEGWRRHQLEPDINIYENIRLAGDSYYVASLDANEPLNWADVSLTYSHEGEYVVKYSGKAPGFVVIPKRWFPGWTAHFDGVDVGDNKYLGILLTARVDGPGEVVFSYRAPYLMLGIFLMLAGVIALALSIVLGWRLKSSLMVI